MYGKLIDGKLQIAPNPLKADGKTIANPNEEMLLKQGYMPVLFTEQPRKEGYYYIACYKVENNKIIQYWQEYKVEETQTLENRLDNVEKQTTENTEQITATQEALCEIYEQII